MSLTIGDLLDGIEQFLRKHQNDGVNLTESLTKVAALKTSLPAELSNVKSDLLAIEAFVRKLLTAAAQCYKDAIPELTGALLSKTVNDHSRLISTIDAKTREISTAICAANASKVVSGGMDLYFQALKTIDEQGSWSSLRGNGSAMLTLMKSQVQTDADAITAGRLFLEGESRSLAALENFPGFSRFAQAQMASQNIDDFLANDVNQAQLRVATVIAGLLTNELGVANARLDALKTDIENKVKALQLLAALFGVVAGFVRLFV